MAILKALDGAEHEQVQFLKEERIGFSAILAVHRSVEGPAFGGVRRYAYRSGADAIRDVLRLSRAMTYKCAMARVAGGGGKCVVLDHPALDVPEAYRLLGRYIESMGGRYYTGPDVGTGPEELAWLAETTSYVTRPGPRGPGNLAAATARGVLAGLRGVIQHLARSAPEVPTDPDDLAGLCFLVQGLGESGFKIARGLVERGGNVLATEVDEEVSERARQELGVELIDPERAYDVPCDIFVPCAMGGILHDLTVERLRCRAVAGSANNILAGPEHGRALHARGILVAPDYLVNSGALILGANFHLSGSRDQDEAIDRIEDEVLALFERAERDGSAPSDLADRIAEERLRKSSGDPWFRSGP
ncbi:MAG: Glu/Leu/Phe/Val dehydrogenase dimerization domain-containing protein [Planctomycetota bacterium]